MKKPSRTIDDAVLARTRPRLIDIWLQAYRSKLDRIRDPDAYDFNTPLARAEYKSTTSARAARKELYKIRSKLRRKSTREHEPGSSLYDTSNSTAWSSASGTRPWKSGMKRPVMWTSH